MSNKPKQDFTVKIPFPSQEAADAFLDWFADFGETDFHSWMSFGDPNDASDVVKFIHPVAPDMTVKTEAYDNFFAEWQNGDRIANAEIDPETEEELDALLDEEDDDLVEETMLN